MKVVINGGIQNLHEAKILLNDFDGVMTNFEGRCFFLGNPVYAGCASTMFTASDLLSINIFFY